MIDGITLLIHKTIKHVHINNTNFNKINRYYPLSNESLGELHLLVNKR